MPLGVDLCLPHLPLCLDLDLDHLHRQRLDSLDHTRAQGLNAGVVRFAEGTAGIGAAAGK